MNDCPSARCWWNPEEDRILQQKVQTQLDIGGGQGAKNWSAIAERLPGRSNKDSRKRWTKIASSSRKGTWSSAEDHLLRKGVAIFGFQWTKVADIVVSRHPDQCAKRWHHSIDPNVKRTPWTREEDSTLLFAVPIIGRDWKEIARQYFPSRSTTDIKNRYVILSRRHAIPTSGQHADGLLSQGHIKQVDMPGIDLSFATSSYGSGIYNLAADYPNETELPRYISNNPCTLSLRDIPDSNIVLSNQDWTAFKGQLSDLNNMSPGVSALYDESYRTSPLTNGSLPQTPGTSSEPRLPASSTLVLEELQPEAVGLVIDALLKTKSKFKMRLYSTGS